MRDIERYWEILRDNERYWEILRDIEICWGILRDIDRYLEILRDIERYWEILRDIERYWEIVRDIEGYFLHWKWLKFQTFSNNYLLYSSCEYKINDNFFWSLFGAKWAEHWSLHHLVMILDCAMW